MANPSKAQDAASVALSAIEEALNLVDATSQEKQKSVRDANARTSAASLQAGESPRDPATETLKESLQESLKQSLKEPLKETAKETSPPKTLSEPEAKAQAKPETRSGGDLDTKLVDSRAEKRIEAAIANARPAANDDRPSVGQILLALQTRPSSKPTLIASLASAVWLSLSGFYLWTGAANENSAICACVIDAASPVHR
jgi:hypothetical protein